LLLVETVGSRSCRRELDQGTELDCMECTSAGGRVSFALAEEGTRRAVI
jgi:hypothetical protein